MAAGWGLERAIRAQMTERGSGEPRQRGEKQEFHSLDPNSWRVSEFCPDTEGAGAAAAALTFSWRCGTIVNKGT